jgi:hypothetical protein
MFRRNTLTPKSSKFVMNVSIFMASTCLAMVKESTSMVGATIEQILFLSMTGQQRGTTSEFCNTKLIQRLKFSSFERHQSKNRAPLLLAYCPPLVYTFYFYFPLYVFLLLTQFLLLLLHLQKTEGEYLLVFLTPLKIRSLFTTKI